MGDRREFELRVRVNARNIEDDSYWRQRVPQPECDTHDFAGYDENDVKRPQPVATWIVTTETIDKSFTSGTWLVVDQFMCTECLDEMEAREAR